jgi:transcriptional regulator with XRE-family HTH domain
MNLRLKHALIDQQVPAYRVAMKANINSNKLSKFIYGLARPSDLEKEQLAEVLGKPVTELFPEEVYPYDC